MPEAYGGPTLPAQSAAKAASTAKDYAFTIERPGNIVGISVHDSGENLNADEVLVKLADSADTVIFNFPSGAAGGTTVYSWNGSIPVDKNFTLTVTVTGPTATTPNVNAMFRPRGQA
jgi:hypothetical protein